MAETGSGRTNNTANADNVAPDSGVTCSLSVNNGSLSSACSGPDSPVVENDSFLFFSYLDEIEDRIENLRRHAIALSQEKSSLLLVLTQLKEESMSAALKKEEFQEICVNMERLRTRCKAVDITVETIRSPEQHEAYVKVSSLVDELEECLSTTDDKPGVIKRTKTYLNACSSDAVDAGAIDFKFQGMILDCVIEDQKLIRHRLEDIVMNYCRSASLSNRTSTATASTTTTTSADCDSERDQSENCIKPSAISSAVKNNPHFDEFRDVASDETSATEEVNASDVDSSSSNLCDSKENAAPLKDS